MESELGQGWQSGFRKSSIEFKEDKITPVLGLGNKLSKLWFLVIELKTQHEGTDCTTQAGLVP